MNDLSEAPRPRVYITLYKFLSSYFSRGINVVPLSKYCRILFEILLSI